MGQDVIAVKDNVSRRGENFLALENQGGGCVLGDDGAQGEGGGEKPGEEFHLAAVLSSAHAGEEPVDIAVENIADWRDKSRGYGSSRLPFLIALDLNAEHLRELFAA